MSTFKPEFCQSAANATVAVYARIVHVPDWRKIASIAYHRGANAKTRGHQQQANQDNAMAETDLHTQQALNGDGEENRQGGTAGDAVGKEETESEAKSSSAGEQIGEPTLPLYAPACPLDYAYLWGSLDGPTMYNKGHGLLQQSHPLKEKCFQDPLREGGESVC